MKRLRNSLVLFHLAFVLIMIASSSCEKTAPRNTVVGKVIDSVNFEPIENVKIFLFQKSGSTFGGCKEYVTYTDKNGEFELKWNPCNNDYPFKISASIENNAGSETSEYLIEEIIIEPEYFVKSSTYEKTIYGPRLANLELIFNNQNPYDENDFLSFSIYEWIYIPHFGTSSEKFKCKVSYNEMHNIVWWTRKNEVESEIIRDSIFISELEGNEYVINY